MKLTFSDFSVFNTPLFIQYKPQEQLKAEFSWIILLLGREYEVHIIKIYRIDKFAIVAIREVSSWLSVPQSLTRTIFLQIKCEWNVNESTVFTWHRRFYLQRSEWRNVSSLNICHENIDRVAKG